ncbi:CaiB/BaiF CoA transferase family protein [Alicyclobacillus cycloheptanicus]|uniref:Crotonobetainyl-CoA:carnitine CoA-transferase CaiB-like acyl-CoA transferase n=1 Tax=Alicyclobacillus cycloheptanicus TaxID=1457 RepID=A0ABT9XH01_9BACL|nr:CoA transferase [Alicyclobacillus cycloheptanicus]MDQ0189380.1 crotonobetainyl-CoA:carnitine CoA-transferase CaiB-like acyl-CoA transferase [Alicyclobacillus cycloheptanicus]
MLEFGSLIAGPFATRLLADFGAEVIKIESEQGDPLRQWGLLADNGDSWWWQAQARNKKLMVLDLHHEEGQAIARDLVKQADVIVENFRPGQMDRWNLGYEALSQVNPEIVYVSVSGFGQSGPYRERPGFGNIAESMSGMRYVTGFPDRPPVRVGFSIGDEIAALYAVFGALMSLLRRERHQDGLGDHVDVALTEAVFSLTEGAMTEYKHANVIQERTGNALKRSAPSNIYPTKDGRYIAIGANTPRIFPRLLAAMGREELANDPRFIDNQARLANIEELDAMIAEWTQTFLLSDLWEKLNAYEVPAGPVMNVADIASDPHYQAREMIIQVPSEELGAVWMPGVVPKLTNFPGGVDHTGNCLGHDTAWVLRTILHWDDAQIEAAVEKGVIAR